MEEAKTNAQLPWVSELLFSRAAGYFGVGRRPTDLRPKPEVSYTHGNAMTQSAQPNTLQDQKIESLGIKGIITALCTQSLKYSEIFKLNSVSITLFSLQNLRFFNKSSKVCILTAAAILESLAGPKSCWLHWYPLLSSFALQNTENTPAMHAINY